MGLVLTYNNKKISSTSTTTGPTPIYTTMIRSINTNTNINTMSSIIHKPSGNCSSCGN